MRQFLLFFLPLIFLSLSCISKRPSAPPPEAVLVIHGNAFERKFIHSDLLNSPFLSEITVKNDPAYPGREMKYKAIPFWQLLEKQKVDETSTMLFKCLDGFSAPLTTARLMNKDPHFAIAYIAVEPEHAKWPRLKPDSAPTAGPFYLVWVNPELSNIGTEEWPFQLASFEVKPPVEIQFPHIKPAAQTQFDSDIATGYRHFIKNCFACHTLNGEGTSTIGPDLNFPFSPTEYLHGNFLKSLIRNPKALRHWPQGRMSGFSPATLPDNELNQIIAYLKHMAGRKHGPPKEENKQ